MFQIENLKFIPSYTLSKTQKENLGKKRANKESTEGTLLGAIIPWFEILSIFTLFNYPSQHFKTVENLSFLTVQNVYSLNRGNSLCHKL